MIKNILDEDPFYNTKIQIFSFTWAGLAASHKSSTIYLKFVQSYNNWVCPKKSGLFQLAWGRYEPFQGFWAYLGPCGVTPRAIAQFLQAFCTNLKGIMTLLCGK